MNVKESHELIIEMHPYADSLNKKLIREADKVALKGYKNPYFTNLGGTKLPLSEDNDAPSKLVQSWVTELIKIKFHYKKNQDPIDYEVTGWFANYDRGEYANSHNHLPFSIFSFVYFIKCPKGSSPLIFSTTGKRLKAEEGKIVIFPSSMMHHVPSNKCEDRRVLAGNFLPYRMDSERMQRVG